DRDAVLLLASVHLAARNTADAEESVARALALDPASADVQLLSAQLLIQQQKPDAALAALEQAIKIEPSARNYLAMVSLQGIRGDTAAAETACRQAVLADPQ